MMKKLVALLMALALLCTSIGAFAVDEGTTVEPEAVAEETIVEEEEVTEEPALEGESEEEESEEEESEEPAQEETEVKKDADGREYVKINDLYVKTTSAKEYTQHKGHDVISANQDVPKTLYIDGKETDVTVTGTEIKVTCTVDGYKWSACKYCGVKFWNQTEESKGHVTETKVVEPTTKAPFMPGLKTTTCTKCDYEVKEFIAPVGFKGDMKAYDWSMDTKDLKEIPSKVENNENGIHKWGFLKKGSDKAATCLEKGQATYWCVDCGEEITVFFETKDHTPFDDYESEEAKKIGAKSVLTTSPTCMEKGVVTYYGCKVCDQGKKKGDKLAEWTDTVTALGHLYTKIETAEATCTTPVITTKICTRPGCDETVKDHTITEESGEKKGHTWERKPAVDEEHDHVIVPATCTERGQLGQAVICGDCGAPDLSNLKDVTYTDALDHQDHLKEQNDKKTNPNGYFYTVKKDAEGNVIEVKVNDLYKTVEPTVIPEEEVTDTAERVFGTDETNGGDKIVVTGIYSEVIVTYVAPTCTETGSITVACSDPKCGAKLYQEIPATDHSWKKVVESAANKPVDCTKQGAIFLECEFCHEQKSEVVEAKPGHVVTDANGNPINIVGYAQQKAGYGKIEEFLASKLGLPVEKILKQKIAVCHEYYAICECTYCQQTEYVLVDGDDEKHVRGNKVITDPASCTEVGYDYWNCANCGYQQSTLLPATKHDWRNGEFEVDPTCTTEGTLQIYCFKCGDFKIDQKTGVVTIKQSVAEKEGIETKQTPALGHHYVKTETEATCYTRGDTTYTCSICKDSYTIEGTYGHVRKGDYKAYEPATCEYPGSCSYECAKCHTLIENEVIPKLGHTYEREGNDWLTEEEIQEKHLNEEKANNKLGADCTAAICSTVGKEHGTIHKLVCGRTGCDKFYTWTEDDVPTEHTMYRTEKDGSKTLNNFVIEKYPTCEEDGVASYTCALCQENIKNYVLPAIPHNLVPHFDKDKGVYVLQCAKIANDKDGRKTFEKLVNAQYPDDPDVAKLIYKELEKDVTYISTFGYCEFEKPVAVEKTEYAVTKDEKNVGHIVLKDDQTMAPLEEVYVRIIWRYELSNGDTTAFKLCMPVTVTEKDIDDRCLAGTFKLNIITAPSGSTLIDRYVQVVVNPDADELPTNTYNYYGDADLTK